MHISKKSRIFAGQSIIYVYCMRKTRIIIMLLTVLFCVGQASAESLPLTLNSESTFTSITQSTSTGAYVKYSGDTVYFGSYSNEGTKTRRWEIAFDGVPDKMIFTPQGTNTWFINEWNGSTWTPTFPNLTLTANQEYTHTLQASTKKVRIEYATVSTNNSIGSLTGFKITRFSGARAEEKQLYILAGSTKLLHITSANTNSALSIEASAGITADVNTIAATGADAYNITTIHVGGSSATTGHLYVKNSMGTLVDIPVTIYAEAAHLPIETAKDDAKRFHTEVIENERVNWDESTRTIEMLPALTNTDRWFTMQFADAPTGLELHYETPDAAWQGKWLIQESADNNIWTTVMGKEAQKGSIKGELKPNTRYLKLTCTSTNSYEAVKITALSILNSAMVIEDKQELSFSDTKQDQELNLYVMNMTKLVIESNNTNFSITDNVKEPSGRLELTSSDYPEIIGKNKSGNIQLSIKWNNSTAIDQATLTISDTEEEFAHIALIGSWSGLTAAQASHTGIYTGLAEGVTMATQHDGSKRREVNLTDAFDAEGNALFDRLYVFGETSTKDGKTKVTAPNSKSGSNSKTPCYIYDKDGSQYTLVETVSDMNVSEKNAIFQISMKDRKKAERTRLYITGFAPYSTSGWKGTDDAIFYINGETNDTIDIYLQDAYLYTRNKTRSGASIDRNDQTDVNRPSYQGLFSKGSGAVFAFECMVYDNKDSVFTIQVHSKDSSKMMSNYGCLLSSLAGYAYQISSPLHILWHDEIAKEKGRATYNVMNLDDKWPVSAKSNETKRTNGFVTLQKQANNAPSIDMGNEWTVVNFCGGRYELQNAKIVSPNYKTTLAISHRGGRYGGFLLSYGCGADEVGGTVNFYDGTTTVLPMTVEEQYKQYYLMDTLPDGTETDTTTCLRCPQNTHVYGGSQCWLRACYSVESKGGAPKGYNDIALGHLEQTEEEKRDFDPDNDCIGGTYGMESIYPDKQGKYHFWLPADCDPRIKPEVDKEMKYWMAAMTYIKAEFMSFGGSIGGPTSIGDLEVSNLLYCTIDGNISEVITAKDFMATVKNPGNNMGEGSEYIQLHPQTVGDEMNNDITDSKPYTIKDHIYYVNPAYADTWRCFTAPFDIKRIWVVETFDEDSLAAYAQAHDRDEALKLQAKHNADFAGFFGVVMALGSNTPFDDIFKDYMTYVKGEDKKSGRWNGSSPYTLRGRYALTPYTGDNASTANFYLYEDKGSWGLTGDTALATSWVIPEQAKSYNAENPDAEKPLLEQGKTYSMLFPYCPGCDNKTDEEGNPVERDYWDYWTGKFLIFEGDGPQTIQGTDYHAELLEQPASKTAELRGNSTFAKMSPRDYDINNYFYAYRSTTNNECFTHGTKAPSSVDPTQGFLIADLPTAGGKAISEINLRSGVIRYEESETVATHVPTIMKENDARVIMINGELRIMVTRNGEQTMYDIMGRKM